MHYILLLELISLVLIYYILCYFFIIITWRLYQELPWFHSTECGPSGQLVRPVNSKQIITLPMFGDTKSDFLTFLLNPLW